MVFSGGTKLTLPAVLFVKIGLKDGPEASDAKESTLLSALTETVDFEAGDFKGADLDNPTLETDLATGAIQGAGGTVTGDKTTLGEDFFWA